MSQTPSHGPPRYLNYASPQANGLIHWYPTSVIRSAGTNDVPIVDAKGHYGTSTYTVSSGNATLVYHPEIGQRIDQLGYYTINTDRTLAGKTNCSVACWLESDVKDKGSNLGRAYYSERRSGGQEIFKLEMTSINTLGTLELTYRDTSGTLNRVGTTTVFEIGVLHHVVFVKKGTAITWYIDGVQDNTGTLTASDTMNTITTTVVGKDRYGGAAWDGKWADLRLYDIALTAEDVAAMYDPNTRWDLYRPQSNARLFASAGAPASTARSFSVVIA